MARRRRFRVKRRRFNRRRRFGRSRGGRRSFRRIRKRVILHDKLFERKYYLTFATDSNLVTGFTLAAPYQLAQGTGVSNRIGNRIFLKTITIRCEFVVTPATGWAPAANVPWRQFRVVALLFKNPNNGGTLTPAEILQDTTNVLRRNLSPFSRERNGKIFKVLMDKRFTLNMLYTTGTALPTGSGVSSRVFTWTFKINRTVVFDANSGSAQDVVSNLFQLDVWQNYGADTNVDFAYTMLFSYIDA